MRATRALIHLPALRKNWETLRSTLPSHVKILPMVKANGYGHGTLIVANESLRLGAVGVGVADMGEALALRQEGFSGEILSLGGFTARDLTNAAKHNIVLTIHTHEEALLLKEATSKIRIHLELETGMNRLGLSENEWEKSAKTLGGVSHVSVEALFTHLAESDAPDPAFTQSQIQKFETAVAFFEKALNQKLIRHVANSGGILSHPTSHFDCVRPGIALYGYPPATAGKSTLRFTPVLEWRAPIVQIKRIAAGGTVGYNRRFRATQPMTIATVAVGYGDGYRRGYASVGVGYQGKRCQVLGVVCMDLMMIDITPLQNVCINDEVALIGSKDAGAPDAVELAAADRTISYEVLTNISARVPRAAVES